MIILFIEKIQIVYRLDCLTVWGILSLFVFGIIDALSGDGFCGMQENEEACIKIIDELIPYALPTLANGIDSEQTSEIYNMAVPDTYPAS